MSSALSNAEESLAATDSNENNHLAADPYWLGCAAGTQEGHSRARTPAARGRTARVAATGPFSVVSGNEHDRHANRARRDHELCTCEVSDPCKCSRHRAAAV